MSMRCGERRDQRAVIFIGALSASIAKKQNKPNDRRVAENGVNEIKGQFTSRPPTHLDFPASPPKNFHQWVRFLASDNYRCWEQATISRGCRYQKEESLGKTLLGGLKSLESLRSLERPERPGDSAESGELIWKQLAAATWQPAGFFPQNLSSCDFDLRKCSAATTLNLIWKCSRTSIQKINKKKKQKLKRRKNQKQAAVAAAGSFLIYSHNFYAPFQWACGGGGCGEWAGDRLSRPSSPLWRLCAGATP